MSRQLLRSTAVVGGMTLISRVLGMLRDMVVARIFGAGIGADAFFVAFRIPNFLRRLFAEGSFAQAFVPVLSQYKEKQTHEEIKDLIDSTVGALGGALFAVTAIGVLASPVLVMIFAPGFIDHPGKYELTVAMVRLTSELIQKAPSYINPLKDRELDLRGNRIPQIENLAVSKVFSQFPLSPLC